MVEKCFRRARGTACIRFDGRRFVMPAEDEYDLQLVLDHSRYLANRHGSALIEMAGRTWQVELAETRSAAQCSDCRNHDKVRYRIQGSSLCRECSSERMGRDVLLRQGYAGQVLLGQGRRAA